MRRYRASLITFLLLGSFGLNAEVQGRNIAPLLKTWGGFVTESQGNDSALANAQALLAVLASGEEDEVRHSLAHLAVEVRRQFAGENKRSQQQCWARIIVPVLLQKDADRKDFEASRQNYWDQLAPLAENFVSGLEEALRTGDKEAFLHYGLVPSCVCAGPTPIAVHPMLSDRLMRMFGRLLVDREGKQEIHAVLWDYLDGLAAEAATNPKLRDLVQAVLKDLSSRKDGFDEESHKRWKGLAEKTSKAVNPVARPSVWHLTSLRGLDQERDMIVHRRCAQLGLATSTYFSSSASVSRLNDQIANYVWTWRKASEEELCKTIRAVYEANEASPRSRSLWRRLSVVVLLQAGRERPEMVLWDHAPSYWKANREMIREWVADRTKTLGMYLVVENGQPALLADADGFLAPSKYQPKGTALAADHPLVLAELLEPLQQRVTGTALTTDRQLAHYLRWLVDERAIAAPESAAAVAVFLSCILEGRGEVQQKFLRESLLT